MKTSTIILCHVQGGWVGWSSPPTPGFLRKLKKKDICGYIYSSPEYFKTINKNYLQWFHHEYLNEFSVASSTQKSRQ
jgi:hypothetical protein